MPKMKLVPHGDVVSTTGGFLDSTFSVYKYYEGQSYFVDDGRVFVDRNRKRTQTGHVVTIYGQLEDSGFDKYRGSLVLQYIDSAWTLYYITPEGTKASIASGGGGSYIGGTNINIDVSDNINLDIILKNMSTITYFDDDFVIGQGSSAIDETPTEIIKIWKSDTGGEHDSKVEIKNAKTRIEDLDFGAW